MWTVTQGVTSGVPSNRINSALARLDEALDFWGRYIDFGSATIDVRIDFKPLEDRVLAEAGTTFREVRPGIFQADTILELQSGLDLNGAAPDIEISVSSTDLINGEFFLGSSDAVPLTQFDLFTVLLHEIAHGLGFLSASDQPEVTVFDTFLDDLGTSSLFFTGPIVLAENPRGAIHVDGEDPSHLTSGLMDATLDTGLREYIAGEEFLILRDIGLPILTPTEFDDVLFGLAFTNDNLFLLSGDDYYEGFSGDDTIDGGGGNDTILGRTGDDSLSGGIGDDSLSGGDLFDSLFGNTGSDTLSGGDRGDLLNGGDGLDTASYADAKTGVQVDLGVSFQPWRGTDTDAVGDRLVSIENIHGSSFNDWLTGNSGPNVLSGAQGRDTLFASGGDDLLNGGLGNDSLSGADGDDTLNGGAGRDTVFGVQGADSLAGGAGRDSLNAGPDDDIARGGADDDTIGGGQGSDFLKGDEGDDILYGGTGFDTLGGGDGLDTLYGGDDGDTLFGGRFSDELFGGSGNDSLNAGNNGDLALGEGGNDTVNGGNGSDMLDGGDGNDLLIGAKGFDTLDGGMGDDTLVGGNASDTLTGGVGNDQFNFNLGNDDDLITDFITGAGTDDVIRLSGFGTAFDTFAEVQAASSDDGFGNTVIDFGGGDRVTLQGVAVASLDADDFVFA